MVETEPEFWFSDDWDVLGHGQEAQSKAGSLLELSLSLRKTGPWGSRAEGSTGRVNNPTASSSLRNSMQEVWTPW